MESLQEFLDLVNLEKIEENIFRATNFKTPWGRIFGGQVLAQSVYAAYKTIPEDRHLHSMHAYFLRAGDIQVPVVYEVDRIRNGGTFNTRRVVAIQKGRAIFNMAASFSKDTYSELGHQMDFPKVPMPEELSTAKQNLEKLKEKNIFLYKLIFHEKPIEFRPVENINPLDPIDSPPSRHVWFKFKERLSDDKRLHQVALAYISDYYLMTTATLPNRSKMNRGAYFFASLDHAMWFHRDFRVDDWLLYQLDSPSSRNQRGLGRGNIYTRDGLLVASTIQEGVIAPYRAEE